MTREAVATHELSHHLVAMSLDARGCKSEIGARGDSGGAFHYDKGLDAPMAKVTMLVAGYIGEELRYGFQGLARSDRREADEILAMYPEAERANLLHQAEERARRLLLAEDELLRHASARLQAVGRFP
jgi:hypothetical protein